MAKTDDLAMREYRRIRRETNERLLSAIRKGRLDDEMSAMDQRARRSLGNGHRKHAKPA